MDGTINSAVLDAVKQVSALARQAHDDGLSRVVDQAAGLAMLNAVQAQQSDNLLADAALARIVACLVALPTVVAPAIAEPPHV